MLEGRNDVKPKYHDHGRRDYNSSYAAANLLDYEQENRHEVN